MITADNAAGRCPPNRNSPNAHCYHWIIDFNAPRTTAPRRCAERLEWNRLKVVTARPRRPHRQTQGFWCHFTKPGTQRTAKKTRPRHLGRPRRSEPTSVEASGRPPPPSQSTSARPVCSTKQPKVASNLAPQDEFAQATGARWPQPRWATAAYPGLSPDFAGVCRRSRSPTSGVASRCQYEGRSSKQVPGDTSQDQAGTSGPQQGPQREVLLNRQWAGGPQF